MDNVSFEVLVLICSLLVLVLLVLVLLGSLLGTAWIMLATFRTAGTMLVVQIHGFVVLIFFLLLYNSLSMTSWRRLVRNQRWHSSFVNQVITEVNKGKRFTLKIPQARYSR